MHKLIVPANKLVDNGHVLAVNGYEHVYDLEELIFTYPILQSPPDIGDQIYKNFKELSFCIFNNILLYE